MKTFTVRMPDDLHREISERAENNEISINEWLNRVAKFAIASKTVTYVETTTKKVSL